MAKDPLNLLPREKHAQVREEKGPSPHFEIEKDGQILYYFGANHSRDPENEQYSKLRDYWKQYLKKVNHKTALVIMEGRERPIADDEKDAIIRGSEGHLITYLAHKENIPVTCSEPDREKIYNTLLEKFLKEEVVLYKFEAFLNTWQRSSSKHQPPLEKYFNETIGDRWGFTLDELKRLHEKILGLEFDEKEMLEVTSPNSEETVINQVARVSSDIRDEYVAREIIQYWNDGKSPFVVFGSGHLIIQEPALRESIE